MARIIRGDGGHGEESSRRRRRASRARHARTGEGPRVLVPVLTSEHLRWIGRVQAAGAAPCPLFHTTVRDLSQSEKNDRAAYSARIDAEEVISAARVLKASAVLTIHLPADLRSRLTALAAAAGLQLISDDHPLAGKIDALGESSGGKP